MFLTSVVYSDFIKLKINLIKHLANVKTNYLILYLYIY